MRETLEQLVARINASAFVPHKQVGTIPTKETKMAKQVKLRKNQEADSLFNGNGRGGAAKYPWDEWFSGELLLLERSEGTENDKGTIVTPTVVRDYGVPTDAMPPKIKTAARRRYKVCQVSRRDADNNRLVDALIIRARDMTAEERQEEDRLRAEEKAAKEEVGEGKVDFTGTPVLTS
jgi:hypothetical protein